jgi:pimeloyl-ACP methyl ester carboxylesterase
MTSPPESAPPRRVDRTSLRVTGADGVELVVHHLGGDGPPLMLLHATGFHGRCWAPLARSLTPAFTVWALDQRGHGASGKAPGGRYDDWGRFAADLLATVDAIGGSGWRAAGHSLGGGVALLAEARRPGTFTSLCCYEPVVIPPGWPAAPGPDGTGESPGPAGPRPVGLAELARKRRPAFASRQAALDNYRVKPPFSRFHPEALEAYVEFGFVDAPDGTVTLACRREDEASTFDGAPLSPTWAELPGVRAPVAVLAGGDPVDPIGRIAPQVARRLPRGGFRAFADLDHFGPFTAPDEVGRVMLEALTVAAPPPGAPPEGSTRADTPSG